ncbi:MAG: molybdate transport system ATP-binding protein [Francisellaceae bacterium]|jgi:molybdate transport system ATP-binding protein
MYFKFNHTLQSFILEVELKLPKNGITAIFGPSGSGKSSLLNCISGVKKPDSAKIEVNGVIWQKDKKNLPISQRKVVLVGQRPYLFPHLTIEQNIMYGYKRLKSKHNQISSSQIIEKFNIDLLLKQFPIQLSGGQVQRVAMAQALLSRPKLLLLDEAFSALDEKQKLMIMNNLKDHISQEKIPMIFITHSKYEVNHLADQVVLMNKGQIEQVISCQDFIDLHNISNPNILSVEEVTNGCELKLENGQVIYLSKAHLNKITKKYT